MIKQQDISVNDLKSKSLNTKQLKFVKAEIITNPPPKPIKKDGNDDL